MVKHTDSLEELAARVETCDRSAFEQLVTRFQAQLESFLRGDCNDDGTVDIADPVATLFAVFLGKHAITCDDACDSNDDGMVDVSDPIATLSHLFLGDPAIIPPPGTRECGVDPTADSLSCESFSKCPAAR